MPIDYYILTFECPRCGHWDEGVEIPGEEYKEAMEDMDGWIDHICSRCKCDFKQQE